MNDVTSYFRTTFGVGLNPIGGDGLFLFLVPSIDMQYGQRTYMEDAYQAFVENGYSQPGDFRIERSLLVGGQSSRTCWRLVERLVCLDVLSGRGVVIQV